MNTRLRIYRIIYCVLLCLTILAYILIREMMFPWMLTRLGILSVMFPVLIAETEVYTGIEYFLLGLRQSKVQTFLKGIRFICGIGILLLGSIGLLALLLKQTYTNEIPFDFGAATILLGLSKLIYSVWEVVKYWRSAPERKVSKVLLLAGKLFFSLLVIYMGWWGMLIGSFILSPG